MKIIINEMTGKDVPVVSQLLISCYRWLGQTDNFPREFSKFLVSERGSIETVTRESAYQTYLVARYDNNISGMVAIEDNNITKLYVSPDYHRKGVSRKLFEAAEKLIIEKGFDNISLVAISRSPVPFYQAMGMSIVEKIKAESSLIRGAKHF